MRKYVYGEYGWNVKFQRGMRVIREGKTNTFEIRTNDAIHKFRRIGNYVERISKYFDRNTFGKSHSPKLYYYYELKSGRRICPIHLEKLVSEDSLTRYERKCSVHECDYKTEPYWAGGGVEVCYTEKFIALLNMRSQPPLNTKGEDIK